MKIADFRARIAGIMNGAKSPDDYLSYASNRNKSPEWARKGNGSGLTPSEKTMVRAHLIRLFNQSAQAAANLK